MRIKAAAVAMAAVFSRMLASVRGSEMKCGHEGANQFNHRYPGAHAQYFIGGDFMYPLIEDTRRKNRRGKMFRRYGKAWAKR